MGKDNKADEMRRWRTGQLNSSERKAMERYGLDTADYGFQRSDRGSDNAGNYDDMRKDFLKAASNDYDTRRSMEAMAMSGKGKAKKIAEGGFRSTGDVMNANNMMRKAHEKAGKGGSFSSLSDFAGVTYGAVERDRKKQDQSYAQKLDNRFKEFEKKQEKDATNEDAGEEQKLSSTAQNAIDFGGKSYAPQAGVVTKEAGELLNKHKNKQKDNNRANGVTGRGAQFGTQAGGLN